MEAYFDVHEPGSYGGFDALRRMMQRKKEQITSKQIAHGFLNQKLTIFKNRFGVVFVGAKYLLAV